MGFRRRMPIRGPVSRPMVAAEGSGRRALRNPGEAVRSPLAQRVPAGWFGLAKTEVIGVALQVIAGQSGHGAGFAEDAAGVADATFPGDAALQEFRLNLVVKLGNVAERAVMPMLRAGE